MKAQTPFVGREKELGELRPALDSVRGGKAGAVFLNGEAGIGKSRLAEEIFAGGEFTVLSGTALEGATPPYGPIAIALRECFRRSPDRLTLDPQREKYLALLVPEIGSSSGDTDREGLIEAVGATFARLAEKKPCALVLEDLQWADSATIEMLPPLLIRLKNDPFLLVGTYESDGVPRGHPLRAASTQLRRMRVLRELAVGPLDREGSDRLVAATLDAPPGPVLAGRVYEQTGGVPFYIEEVCSGFVEGNHVRRDGDRLELVPGDSIPLPPSVRDAVLLRIEPLSEKAVKHLEIAAVAGTEVDIDLLVTLAGTEDGLDELFGARVIEESSNRRTAFRHTLARDAVLGEIAWSRRRALHREVAAYLESKGGHPEAVAEHWLAADAGEKARRALLESAERSCRLYAYDDAERAARRALDVWPEGKAEAERAATLERLARCAQMNGKLDDAVRAVEELLENPVVRKDPARRGGALRLLATIAGLQGAVDRVLSSRRAAADAFLEAGSLDEAVADLLIAADRTAGLVQYEEALEVARDAGELARKANRVDLEARAASHEGFILAKLDRVDEGRDAVRRGLDLALENDLSEIAAECYRQLAVVAEHTGDYGRARKAYQSALTFCENEGQDAQVGLCIGCMCYVFYRAGDWGESIRLCRELLRRARATNRPNAVALGTLGLINVARGETGQARKRLRKCLQVCLRDRALLMEMLARWGCALVEEQDGLDDAAADQYRQMLEVWRRGQDRFDSIPALSSAVEFFANRGNEKEAAQYTEALAQIVSHTGNPHALAGLAFALGETALMHDDPGQAFRQFEQALNHVERMGILPDLAKIEYRTAVALSRTGAQAAAVNHLHRARRLARKLGAAPLVSRVAKELKALGEPVEEPRKADTGPRADRGGLTRRQVEVARLVSEGLTNKEIADRLFLSPRTVDMHVANILDRLDSRSRSEAVRKAAELGILT